MNDIIKANRECCKDVKWISKERWEKSGDLYGLPEFCFVKINEPLNNKVSYSDLIVYLMKQFNSKEYLEIGISVLKNLYQVACNTDAKIMGFDINDINTDIEIPRPWGFVKGNVLNELDWTPLKALDIKHDFIFSDALHSNAGLQAEWDYYIKDHLADNFVIIWDDAHQNPKDYITKYFLPELEKRYGTIYTKLLCLQEWVVDRYHPVFVVSNINLKCLESI